MKFAIKHEIKGRMRIHVAQYRMSCAQADTLLYTRTGSAASGDSTCNSSRMPRNPSTSGRRCPCIDAQQGAPDDADQRDKGRRRDLAEAAG